MRLKNLSKSFIKLTSQPIFSTVNSKLYATSISRKIVLSITLGTLLYYFKPYKAIEDTQLSQLKKNMIQEISKLKNQYGQMTIYPDIKYDLRGHTYTIQFEIDQRKCNIFNLISIFFSIYQGQENYRVVDFKSLVQGNVITWYVQFEEKDPKFKTPQRARLTITGVSTNQRPSFRLIFQKNDTITPKNIQALKDSYRQAIKPKQLSSFSQPSQHLLSKTSKGSNNQKNAPPVNKTYQKLQQFGVTIFDPNDRTLSLDWDYLAGYETQKRLIEDTVLLALNYPQIYDQITSQTRVKYEPNRPKAVLFEGPPGTGKTTSAKIISQQVNIPLIYLPIEAIVSKFYGQSQQKLSSMWQQCKKLGKVIIFIDEIDALATSRDNDMHEASRRILSTLLRKIDSFQSTTDVLLICATNRKQDLDPAMLSRIDLSIKFSLPDKQSRAAIFSRYAKHLTAQDRNLLAEHTEGFSGRNISDICKHAQRRWASKLIRNEVSQKLPTLNEYVASLNERKRNELD